MTWTQTYTGKAVDLLNPRPEQIDLADIAIALAGIPRYNRQSRMPWTVAEHSVLVADEVRRQFAIAEHIDPEDRARALHAARFAPIYALLHDAHEAYTGDLIAPLKHLIGAETDLLECIERGLDLAIYAALELKPPSKAIRALIREHDLRALMTERRDLCSIPPMSWGAAIEAVRPYEHVTLVPDPSEARRRETWLYALRGAMHVANASENVLQLVRDAQDVCRSVPDPGY
jgi:hypothetical protein